MQNQPYSDTTIDELRQIYLFTSLNDQQLAQIKENMRHIQLDEGNFLFKHGEHAARFFMLKKGHIKLLRLSREGAEKVFEVVSPGETFAEAAMFMPQSSYPMTAQAISDSSILCFENQIVIDILKESWDACSQLMFQMSQRIHMWINEIDHLTLQSATYRLINYLLYQIPDNHKNVYKVKFPVPKHVIASRLSIKPETLSRILHTLNKEGFITVKGSTIRIHNVDRLRLHAVGVDVVSQ
ncbi:MAG: Crp/Fnr family transcriptional regulator [Thiomargarita sp.]|nr:Crp/Fnr family transcriptional regulator [Thiomargarita sp.]